MKISVVTATYNHIKSLPKLYKSLVAQKEYLHEWLICDDGSTDGTWQYINLVKGLGEIPIEGFSQTRKGMRLARNLNNGLKRATGDLVFIVMGDSYLQSDTLQQLHDTYIKGSAGCGVRENVDDNGTFIRSDWRLNIDDRKIYKGMMYAQMTGNSMIVDRHDLARIGYWDEGYEGYGRDDYSVFLRLNRDLGRGLVQYNNIRINHVYHKETKEDNPLNIERFNKELHNEL
jgi:glycosyltransferase involved in cell wall biosynthesis